MANRKKRASNLFDFNFTREKKKREEEIPQESAVSQGMFYFEYDLHLH